MRTLYLVNTTHFLVGLPLLAFPVSLFGDTLFIPQATEQQKPISAITLIAICCLLIIVIALSYKILALRQRLRAAKEREIGQEAALAKWEEEKKRVSLLDASIRQQVEAHEALEVFRNQIYHVLAQELRDPLAALVTLQQDLTEGNLSIKEMRQVGQDSQRTIQSLYLMTQTLVFWVRVQKNGLQPKHVKASNTRIVHHMIKELQPLAEGYQTKIKTATLEECISQFDIDLSQQILKLLLFNAIRFSIPEEHIICSSFPGEGRVLFSIIFQPEDRNLSIAEWWNSANPTKSPIMQPDSATGLTIWLAKRLLQILGGSSWEEYEEGYGQTLKFAIPLSQ